MAGTRSTKKDVLDQFEVELMRKRIKMVSTGTAFCINTGKKLKLELTFLQRIELQMFLRCLLRLKI